MPCCRRCRSCCNPSFDPGIAIELTRGPSAIGDNPNYDTPFSTKCWSRQFVSSIRRNCSTPTCSPKQLKFR
ncbi:Uncharacterized protein HZ326_7844 [Fusarium oxysporum f. sp. albedinis]|nr:Uncharacterized protein HZ326_7844 [Fusarium oxysporum f. sp. albedinis]